MTNYVGQGDATAHSNAGLVLDLNASMATGSGAGVNSPATTVWQDLSGNNLNATLNTFAYTTTSGWIGNGTSIDPYSLAYDGIDDRVLLPNGLIIPHVFTMELWVKLNSLATQQTLFRRAAGTGSGLFVLRMEGNTGVYAMYATIGAVASTTAATAKAGVWQQVFAWCDSSYVYIQVDNGTVYKVADVALASQLPYNYGLAGVGGISGATYFSGSIATCRLYNRVLSDAERTQNYNAGYLWSVDSIIQVIAATATVQALSPQITANSIINAVLSTATVQAVSPQLIASASIQAVKTICNAYAVSPKVSADAVINALTANATFKMLSPTVQQQIVQQLLRATSYVIERKTLSSIKTRSTKSEVIS